MVGSTDAPARAEADDNPASLLRILESTESPGERLVALVRWFDRTYDDDATSTKRVAFVRAFVVAGRLLARHLRAPESHPVALTLAAAEAFVATPTAEAYETLSCAATLSYPYGPGDGCYSLPGDEPHGARGTGCVSGSGTLFQIGLAVGPDAVMRALADGLVPWLTPLASGRR